MENTFTSILESGLWFWGPTKRHLGMPQRSEHPQIKVLGRSEKPPLGTWAWNLSDLSVSEYQRSLWDYWTTHWQVLGHLQVQAFSSCATLFVEPSSASCSLLHGAIWLWSPHVCLRRGDAGQLWLKAALNLQTISKLNFELPPSLCLAGCPFGADDVALKNMLCHTTYTGKQCRLWQWDDNPLWKSTN